MIHYQNIIKISPIICSCVSNQIEICYSKEVNLLKSLFQSLGMLKTNKECIKSIFTFQYSYLEGITNKGSEENMIRNELLFMTIFCLIEIDPF